MFRNSWTAHCGFCNLPGTTDRALTHSWRNTAPENNPNTRPRLLLLGEDRTFPLDTLHKLLYNFHPASARTDPRDTICSVLFLLRPETATPGMVRSRVPALGSRTPRGTAGTPLNYRVANRKDIDCMLPFLLGADIGPFHKWHKRYYRVNR